MVVEVIVLSDSEGEVDHSPRGARLFYQTESHPNVPNGVTKVPKKPYRLVLVDSRRCPRMPRPRFLPISLAHEASTGALLGNHGQTSDGTGPDWENMTPSAAPLRCGAEIDNEEEDPDYEDLRLSKRRRTDIKRVPKKHGKLTAPDWEVIRNREGGGGRAEKRPILPAKAVSGRKEARDYVKRLTANVDWENILRHLEMLRLTAEKPGHSEIDPGNANSKPRRGPSQVNRLKQYWHGVLTKSLLKMDADRGK